MVLPFLASDHFNQFDFGGGGLRMQHSFMCVIWFATVWEIWKEINNRIFNRKDCPILRLVDKIKLYFFSWLNVNFVQFFLNYHGWWLSPPSSFGLWLTVIFFHLSFLCCLRFPFVFLFVCSLVRLVIGMTLCFDNIFHFRF